MLRFFPFISNHSPPKSATLKKQNPGFSKGDLRVAGRGTRCISANLHGQAGTTAASEKEMSPHYLCWPEQTFLLEARWAACLHLWEGGFNSCFQIKLSNLGKAILIAWICFGLALVLYKLPSPGTSIWFLILFWKKKLLLYFRQEIAIV